MPLIWNLQIDKRVKNVKPIGNHYREFREKPLLILYIVQIKNSTKYKNVVAYGISFPKIGNSDLCSQNRKGIYKVNQIWWSQYINPTYNEMEELDEE